MKKFNLKIVTLTPLYSGEVRKDLGSPQDKTLRVRTTVDNKVILNLKGALRAAYEIVYPDESDRDKNSDLVNIFGAMGKSSAIQISFMISDKPKSEIVSLSQHQNIKNKIAYNAEEVIEGVSFSATLTFLKDSDVVKYWDKIKVTIDALDGYNGLGVGGWTKKGYGKVQIKIS